MTSETGGSQDGPGQPLLSFPAPAPSWAGLIAGGPNEAAIGLAARPEAWATHALCVTGPARCGLSYLAQAWSGRFGGQYLTAQEFSGLKL